MKLSLLMMISIVGILLMCLSNIEAAAPVNVNDPFYKVLATDPAPTNIHTNCYNNTIFYIACCSWTDPFNPLYPNAIKLRRPYSRYTLVATSSLGGILTVPNIVIQELTLTRNSAPNLIAPGATVTFKVAGQQIDNPAALSQFSPIPLVLVFPPDITQIPPYSITDPDTTNGISGIRIKFDNTAKAFVASWVLGTRTVTKVTLNIYCFRGNDDIPKVTADGGITSSTATTLSVPFNRKGKFTCKTVLNALYSNNAYKDFRRDKTINST